jgi:DNA-binding response OmpR family regulator
MAADVALDGMAGLELALVNRYDVIVLDRDLPGCTATTSAASSPRRVARPFTNSVRVTVMRLRQKLGPPPVIEPLPGAGYRI